MVAIRVHAGQVDKQGEPYLLHVLRVVEAVGDEAKPLAALHDTVEDAETHLVGARLASETGVGYWDLVALTRSETGACEKHCEGTYADYIAHIAGCGTPLAREVKIADLRDNLGRIPPRESAYEDITLRPLVGEPVPTRLDLREEWDREWASLKARYEKALAVLESREAREAAWGGRGE
jgi:hypothetical protein